MVLVGEMQGNQEKAWFRCPRCHHLALLLIAPSVNDNDIGSKLKQEDYKIYSPEISYKIGEVIFHSALNDYGRILKKEVTSSGNCAIVVKFEKLGEKKLVENFKSTIQDENINPYEANGNREEVN